MEFKVKKNQEIPTKTGINSNTPDRIFSKHPIRIQINKLKLVVDGVGDAVEVGPIATEPDWKVQHEARKIRSHVAAIYKQLAEHKMEPKKFIVRSVYKPDGGYIKIWRIE